MCRAVTRYLASLREAWNTGWTWSTGLHDYDTELTAYEEANECPEASRTATPLPVVAGTAAATTIPPDPGGGGQPLQDWEWEMLQDISSGGWMGRYQQIQNVITAHHIDGGRCSCGEIVFSTEGHLARHICDTLVDTTP